MEYADNYTMENNEQKNEWKNALKIDDDKLQELSSSCPEESNFTYWCLKSQALNTDEYLVWAREHYSIPQLSDSFFFDQKDHILNTYAQFQDKELWNVNAIPIAEWDDVLYVATVEPSALGYFDKKVQFLLVSQDVLEVQWHKFNSTYTGATTEDAATTVRPTSVDNMSVRSQLEDTSSSAEDLMADLEHLSHEISSDAVTIDTDPGSAESAIAELELTSVGTNIERSSLELTQSDASDIMAELENAVENKASIVEKNMSTVEQNFEAQINASESFDKINQQFNASMVLSYNASAQTVTVVSHDGSWDESSTFHSPYDISKPCAFNIVVKTKKAFHGKAFPNAANKNFFKQVGHATLPPHISVCPIHSADNETIGFLLSTGEAGQSAKKIESLSFAEKCAQDMVELLEIQSKAA